MLTIVMLLPGCARTIDDGVANEPGRPTEARDVSSSPGDRGATFRVADNGSPVAADQPSHQTSSPLPSANSPLPKRLDSQFLPNAVQIHVKVISGGLPERDAAFQELADLGVKTIISVDGAKPDTAMAKRHGLRYVHLPHGYDGIPEGRVWELAKAVRDLEGPIYIHCHHGKHRSPAAACVACVSAGLIPSSAAVSVLTLAGTNPDYRGLYHSVQEARPFESNLLDALEVAYRETVDVPAMAEAMVQLEHTHDHLMRIAAAGWRTPYDHPDLDPAHEALLLREHFTELLRSDEVQQQPADFQDIMRDSESTADELKQAIEQWPATPNNKAMKNLIASLAHRIADNCQTCHAKYRDLPTNERK